MKKIYFTLILLVVSLSLSVAQSSNKKAQKNFDKGKKAMEKYMYIQATVDFTHAISYDRDFAEAYFLRGRSFLSIERADAAIKDFKSTIEKDPTKIMAYLELMNQYRIKKDYSNALAIMDELGEALPKYVGVTHYQNGATYEQMKETKKAIEAYENALKTLDPEYDSQLEELIQLSKDRLSELKKD